MPIVEATGFAQASSEYRSNPAWARSLKAAVEAALQRCQQLGITDPIEIQARMNAARATLAKEYNAHMDAITKARVQRELQQRERAAQLAAGKGG